MSFPSLFDVLIKENYYKDSLQLLKISDDIKQNDGILDAAIVMGTKTNKEILNRLGFNLPKVNQAKDTDVIIAIIARDKKSLDLILSKAEALLEGKQYGDKESAGESIGTINTTAGLADRFQDLDSAVAFMPDANLALISIPGEYVKDICFKLIDAGIHQQLFSDHVPIEDELEIKKYARENGILILGPGAGTSIINGKGIGFSNAVKIGPVGIVAAAGTGLQEVCILLDHCGVGIKHALGVGGNDPKAEIGGIMMLESIRILDKCDDDEIKVIGIISKPPSTSVEKNFVDYVLDSGTRKKYVICFIGGSGSAEIVSPTQNGRVIQANTLASSALAIAKQIGDKQFKTALKELIISPKILHGIVQKEWEKLQKDQKYIRALYTGGTFAYETQVVLTGIIGGRGDVYSNAPIAGAMLLHDPFKSLDHSIVDLGEEEFTKGRAHPMIDPTIRKIRLIEEAADPGVAVLLLDYVLGFGSHPDPIGAILSQVREAKKIAEKGGRYLAIVTHVCGTAQDPQGYEQSIQRLKDTGALIMPTNALAAIASATIALRGNIDLDKVYSKYLTGDESGARRGGQVNPL
jgi:FdrA protein